MMNTYYDVEKKVIVGAKYGSLGYFHEEGHLKLHAKYKFLDSFALMWSSYLVFVVLWFLIVQDYFWAWFWFAPIPIMIFIDEGFAWIYAFIRIYYYRKGGK